MVKIRGFVGLGFEAIAICAAEWLCPRSRVWLLPVFRNFHRHGTAEWASTNSCHEHKPRILELEIHGGELQK